MAIDWVLAGKILWFAGVAAWVAIRWVPNRRSRKAPKEFTARSPRERLSMVVSWFGLGGIPAWWAIGGAPAAFDHSQNWMLVAIGAALFALSLRLFRVTHKALGAMWSHSLDLRKDHKLVMTGIYEKLRHPMYSAFWLWALAQPFLLANWIAGFSGLVGFGTLYFLRIGEEEAMMEERFGEEYRTYRKRTARIIPGIY
jgi:protein-S-isoprenylcysteine O-methyltransferase Ste14